MNHGREWPDSARNTRTEFPSGEQLGPARRLTGLAHLVPITGSLVLWAIAIALLPPDVADAAVLALLLATHWLTRPRREDLAVRLLAQGAPISRGQEMVLQPALTRLTEAGLAPPRLYVAPPRGHQMLAEPVGRRSMVLAPRLLARSARGNVDAETLAVVLAHAEARRVVRSGMRHDIALRIVLIPGRTFSSLVRGLARRLRWVPGAGLSGLVAAVVISTAVWRTFTEGVAWIGLIIALMASFGVISHAARAAWRTHVDSAADRLLADRGLGGPLARLLLSEGSRRSLDRVEAVSGAQALPVAPVRRLRIVSGSSV
ncbi:MAG: hypothetical protein NVSMB48_00540 [Marmoricola sp.]